MTNHSIERTIERADVIYMYFQLKLSFWLIHFVLYLQRLGYISKPINECSAKELRKISHDIIHKSQNDRELEYMSYIYDLPDSYDSLGEMGTMQHYGLLDFETDDSWKNEYSNYISSSNPNSDTDTSEDIPF